MRLEQIAARRNTLIGQETTVMGGMAKALRTIPVVLGVTLDIKELAPGTLLVNFDRWQHNTRHYP